MIITLFTILALSCATISTHAATITPSSQFARAQLVYGTSFIQDEPTNIAVAFYNASGYQINPSTIDLSTVSVRQVVTGYGGFRSFSIASSGYGIQFTGIFYTAGSQSISINVNGASLSVPVNVNATTFASARFIVSNTFNASKAYEYVSVAFYKPTGAQINPLAIDVSSVSVQSVPAGITVSNIRDSAYGIQFSLSFPAAGFYTIYININGQRVALNATVASANGGNNGGATTTASPVGVCSGSVRLEARNADGSSWTSGNTNYKIFDVSVVNTGSCSVTSSIFPYQFAQPATITSSWNLRLDTPQGYGSVIVYGQITPGNTYTGAGLIVANYTSFSGLYRANAVSCSNSPCF